MMDAPQKTEQDWAIDIPPEFAQALGVVEGSMALLHTKQGKIEIEILPPPSAELIQSSRRIYEKYKEEFEEMKRLGD